MVGRLADRRPRVRRQQQRVRARHARQPELAQRLADHVRVVPDLGRQGEAGVARGLADAGDPGLRVAVEDRAVLGEGDLLGGVLDRLPVRVLRSALNRVDIRPAQGERGPELDHRPPGTQRRLDAVAGRLDRLRVPGAEAGQRQPVRAGHVDGLARRGVPREGAPGFLFDACPCGGGDRGQLAVQVIHRNPPLFLAVRYPLRPDLALERPDAERAIVGRRAASGCGLDRGLTGGGPG